MHLNNCAVEWFQVEMYTQYGEKERKKRKKIGEVKIQFFYVYYFIWSSNQSVWTRVWVILLNCIRVSSWPNQPELVALRTKITFAVFFFFVCVEAARVFCSVVHGIWVCERKKCKIQKKKGKEEVHSQFKKHCTLQEPMKISTHIVHANDHNTRYPEH